MSFAHVESVDALKQLRAALWKFTEAANQSLSEAEADLQRTLNWLEHDARTYWQGQIRRRTKDLARAKEALAAKTAISRKDGTKPSAIEEHNAVTKAKLQIEQAEQKLERVRQLSRVLQHEALLYRGLMQRFVTAVQIEVPAAAAHLDGLIGSLTQYTAPEEAASAAPTPGPEQAVSSMQRPELVEPVQSNETQQAAAGAPEGEVRSEK